MRTHPFRLTALACLLAGCQSPPAFDACRAVLAEQAAAWNRGDLEAFCATYRHSAHTVFAGPDRAEIGWEALSARFRRAYPDRESMGRLAFSDLSFAPLGTGTVVARGHWQLARDADRPAGFFVIVLREIEGKWTIVLDYTNRDEGPAAPSAGGN